MVQNILYSSGERLQNYVRSIYAYQPELQVVVVNKDPLLRQSMRELIHRYCCAVSVVAEAGTPEEATLLLRAIPADLLIQEVESADDPNFDWLDRHPELAACVVFTACDKAAAARAFRCDAVDFLLQPVNSAELIAAVEKTREVRRCSYLQQQLSRLIYADGHISADKIRLQAGAGFILAKFEDIIRLESCGNYCFVYLDCNERCLVSHNLKELEEKLPSSLFFRPHQSHLINTSRICRFDKADGLFVKMQDGARVPVSRRRKGDLLAALAACGR